MPDVPFHLPALPLAVAVLAAAAATGAALRRALCLVTVTGTSMSPALQPGDRLVVRRSGAVRRGDIVVAPAPLRPRWAGQRGVRPGTGGDRWIVKRVAALPGDRVDDALRRASGLRDLGTVPEGSVVLVGDGRHSEDSRHWGPCPESVLLGRAVLRLSGAGVERLVRAA